MNAITSTIRRLAWIAFGIIAVAVAAILIAIFT